MKAYYDFHIHTGLSPCGDNENTPNNIINMSLIKELSVIAVCDHNTARNLPAVLEVSKSVAPQILVICGIEIESAEEVHMLCLFRDLDSALKMGGFAESSLPNIKNRPEIFGEQLIFDKDDKVTGTFPGMLVTATGLSIDKITGLAHSLKGVAIPAHIDRDSYSILSNLGFIPSALDFKTVEISKKGVDLYNLYSDNYRCITNSDAHRLEDISEPERFIEIADLTADNVIDYLRGF